MEHTNIFAADLTSGKLKVTLIIIGWSWLKMGVVVKVKYLLYVDNKLINWADFLHADTNSRKLKLF